AGGGGRAAPEVDRPGAIAQHLHGGRLREEARRVLQARVAARPQDHVLPAHARGDVGGEVHGQGGRAQRGAGGRRAGESRARRRGRGSGRGAQVLLHRQSGLRGLRIESASLDNAIAGRRARFKALHARGCLVLPNPWDVGSAKLLEGLGFKALATTSSGQAWSQGHPDGEASRDAVLAHLRAIVGATDLPVNADFESGYAADAAGVAQSVRMAIETGVAGISIEDSTGNATNPIRTIDDALARLRAARAAIDESRTGTLLIGRAENFFLGRPDIGDTIVRLKAYSDAGADCLYAPGIRTRDEITAVVKA